MLSAPYNFVPISDRVFFPDWADDVSMDKPFADGEDGIIEFKLTNVTPFFTRNGAKRDAIEEYSAFVINPDGTRSYYIPGTTIKGCIRSIMECLSFAKMGPYNKSYFGMVRDFDTKKTDNKSFMESMKHVKCGWLQKDDDSNYFIVPCLGGIQKIHHDDLKRLFPFNPGEDHKTAELKQKSLRDENGEWYPIIDVNNNQYSFKDGRNQEEHWVPAGQYAVVCTGFMAGKVHEYLFSVNEGNALPVSRHVYEQFDSVHSNSEYYALHGKPGFLKKRLESGERIPVFFIEEGKTVQSIGITRMYRLPYEYGVKDAIDNYYQETIDFNQKDLPEVIFGYIGDTSTRGRVSFGHAFCQETITDGDLKVVKGVLGQPSASYYPLYLEQNTAPYNTYRTQNLKIAGRKRYRIISGDKTNSLPAGNGNEKVGIAYKALPANHTFCCKVAVHNLRKAEIGALLSAMTLHNTEGVYLNMGLAKSFGFGKMKVCVDLGSDFKYKVDDYLRDFEVALAQKNFMLGCFELDKLVSIASEHRPEDMQMMKDPKTYGEEKKNDHFSKLSECNKHIKWLLTAIEIKSIYEEYNRDLNEQKKKEQEFKETVSKKKNLLESKRSDYERKVGDLNRCMEAAKLNETTNQKNNALSSYEDAFNTRIEINTLESEINGFLNEFDQLGIKVSFEILECPKLEQIKQKIEELQKPFDVKTISESLQDFKGKGVGKLIDHIRKEIRKGNTVSESDVNAIAEKCVEQIINNSNRQQDRDRWKDESKWKDLANALGSEELKNKVFQIVLSKL